MRDCSIMVWYMRPVAMPVGSPTWVVKFWIACALVVVFPYDSLIALMAMTSLLARRSNRNTTIRATVGGTIVTLISQLRDALQQPKASIWHLIFAQPHTGGDSGSPMVMLVEEPTVIITATVASLVFVTIATLIGLHIRSRARLRTANAVASAATTHAATLQTDLTNQQLADAIAAEAHDTLAHSLSLMALNASALKAEAAKLGDSPEAQSLADKAEDIRRQSAGALDEAHSIIDMLRNPHQAWEQLAPSDDTSLTRESLDALIAEDRQQLLQHWLPALLNGIAGEMECQVSHGNAPSTWLVINASPEKNEHGETIGYIGSLTDITSQKTNEEILRQSATVFDHTREGIMITDTQSHILRINPALTELFGYTEQELLHETPAIFKSGQHSTEFYQMMWHAIKTSGYWRGEIWNRRKDGELIPLIGSISSVHDNKHQLTHYVSVYTDIRQLKDSEAQLEHLARHDPLTQLPNRSLLAINLAHALALAERRQQRVALIMLDLDRFKDVNDSFGHQIGDVLLQEVALRLRKRIRESDTICRLGGDEFTVLVEGNPDISAIDHIAEEILQLLTVPFHLPNGRDVIIGASIGISLYPEHGDTPEDLLQQADAAMYRAKASGRSCFRYFSDELTLAAERRLDLEVRLRRAIELNELRVYFQPQVDIVSNRIIGAEALVRWQDPNRGLIAPINFIPVAEETGLIKQLGEWVLFETCRQGNEWLQKGLPAINLAVNISPVQFRYSNIMESVVNALDETGFPAAHLELELTESALMTHETEAAEILNQLRQLGVRLAIDDFGTGYSSLAYLKRFPLDVLKIDKSFVDDIPHKKDDMEIAATIVAMAHTLRLKVMAEGVETEEQLAFLKSQGCDCYQGYLMSPPLPAAQFEQLLWEQQLREHQPV